MLAEREGFEPPIPFQVCRFSRPEPSTARPPLRGLPDLSRLYVEFSRLQGFQAAIRPSNEKAGARGSRSFHAPDLLLTLELIGQCAYTINLAQGLEHPGRMNRNGAILCAVVNEVSSQRLDISVEDQPD